MAIAILTGDTYEYRARLRNYWTWNPQLKAWTLEVEESETEDTILSRYVRDIAGIRNRGHFSVRIERS